MSDVPRVILSSESEGPSCYGDRAELIVRCDEGGPAVFFDHGCFTPHDDALPEGDTRVEIRFDSGEATSRTLRLSSDETAAGYFRESPRLNDLVRRIAAAEQVAIRVFPYRDPPQTLSFQVAGLTEAIGESGIECGIPEALAQE